MEHRSAEAKPATIAAVLGSAGNRRLLRETLGSHHRILGRIRREGDGEPECFDLAIVDLATIERERETLERLRQDAGDVILPALLLADPSRRSAPRIQAELGHTVDDIVRIPTTGAELRARTENLLRLRRLSLALQQRLEHSDRALKGATHALRILHEGNEVLIRAQCEEHLLSRICSIIAEQDGYDLAWVGFADPDTEDELRISASAGPASEYIRQARVDRERFGDGPAWRAITHGEARTVTDVSREPNLEAALERLREHDLNSLVALPIRPAGGPPGVLMIYSRDPGDFRAEAHQLLERLARNLEYGLEALRTGRERERQRTEIEHMVYTDSLTGLSNRSHLVERLDELLANTDAQRELAILFLDLDAFKLINDALGHLAGDRVLRQAAQRLATVIRPGDLLARQGGDEFIVVMVEPSRSAPDEEPMSVAEAAMSLAERLAHKLQEPMIVEGHERRLGVSIGIALYPDHATEAEALLDCADVAMYAAKARDDSVSMYSHDLTQARQRRLSLESRLTHAFEQGELTLHYQPVFALDSGKIESFEALLRWPQDAGSMISPGEFMPIAEETELILPIGSWVLETAAHQLAEWRAEGLDLRVAVNLSVRQLEPADRILDMAERVSRHAPPEQVSLELTEGSLATNADAAEQHLWALHRHGFRLAIDDFGTGYSSLSRLQGMPIDTLKIDKSFVTQLGRGPRGAAIARAVHQLATNLDMATIAEGVETDAQRQELAAMGCQWGQGFWCSPAVPPEQVPPLVQRGAILH